MKQIKIYFFCSLLMISMSLYSCSIIGGDKGEIIPGVEGEYSGIYTQGFEDSDFNPCINERESWQLNSEDPHVFNTINEPEGNPVYVNLRGVPSAKGKFSGIYATYDRQFEVREVVEARSLKERNCF